MEKISLKETAGIDINLDRLTGEISFSDEFNTIKPDIRRIAEATPYYFDSSRSEKDLPLYLMYRGVCKRNDSNKISNSGLRYDITVILPGQ